MRKHRTVPYRPRKVCCWTDCLRTAHKDLPLCWTHLTIAHGVVEKQGDPSFVTSYTYRPSEHKSEPVPEPVEPAPQVGVVYYLRVGGYIKIGWTSDLERRMRGYSPDSTLLAVHPGTRKDERAVHRKFAHLKTHGREWFPLAPQITEHIDSVVAEHGAPPAVDFSARKAQRIVGPRLNKYVGGEHRGPWHARRRPTA